MDDNMLTKADYKRFKFDRISKKDLKKFVKRIPPLLKKDILEQKDEYQFELYDLFHLLKYIYIGQNVRDHGLIKDDCINVAKFSEELIDILFKLNLIDNSPTSTNAFKNYRIIVTSKLGSLIASHWVNLYLKNLNIAKLIKKFGEFPLFYINEKKTIKIDKKFRHYSGPITSIFSIFSGNKLNDFQDWCSAFHSRLVNLFNFLQFEKLICVEANNYAGVNNGDYRQPRYLIPEEFHNFLRQNSEKLNQNKFKRFLLDYKNIVRMCFYYFNYFRKYNEEDYSKTLEYYSRDVNDLIKGQITELKNKNIISCSESFVKDDDLLQLPFKVVSKNDFDTFTTSLKQNIILKLNLIIENVINGNFYEKKTLLEFFNDIFLRSENDTTKPERIEEKGSESSMPTEYHEFWMVDYCPACNEKIADKKQIYCETCGTDISVFKKESK